MRFVKKWDVKTVKIAISETPVSAVQTMMNKLMDAHQTERVVLKRRKKYE